MMVVDHNIQVILELLIDSKKLLIISKYRSDKCLEFYNFILFIFRDEDRHDYKYWYHLPMQYKKHKKTAISTLSYRDDIHHIIRQIDPFDYKFQYILVDANNRNIIEWWEHNTLYRNYESY